MSLIDAVLDRNELPVHPETGVHYAHLVTGVWGVHVDIRATWQHFAERCPWISVHDPDAVPDTLWEDPHVLVICWHMGRPMPTQRGQRKAHTAIVYSEAVGPPGTMLYDHVVEHAKAKDALRELRYDAVFGHTPGMMQHWLQEGEEAYVLPLGYDPAVYGTPWFEAERKYSYVYYGSTVAKRALVMPYLKERLGPDLTDLSGCFGKSLRAEMDRAKASLYVAHSDVESFSTWRIWQTLGTSACLVAEKADSWPLVPERHFVEIPRITWVNAKVVADHLSRLLTDTDLLGTAKRAYEEIGSEYSVERCINQYLVPAGAELCGR